jgi:hypothetical protein
VPVRKFRTFEEARDALSLPSGDPRILRLQRLAQLARPTKVRRGVTRFRTIAEAKAGKFVSDVD